MFLGDDSRRAGMRGRETLSQRRSPLVPTQERGNKGNFSLAPSATTDYFDKTSTTISPFSLRHYTAGIVIR